MIVTDDLDGSVGAETVTFGLDGTTFEMDLSAANRVRLADVYAPFIAGARPVAAGRPGSVRADPARVDRQAVRAWARDAGLKVADRGRLSAEIIRRYEANH